MIQDLKSLTTKLRELASKATPGQWAAYNNLSQIDSDNGLTVLEMDDNDGISLSVSEADFNHMAAANPENILRLLDALEEVEKALEEIDRIAPGTRQIRGYDKDEQREYAEALNGVSEALSKLRGGR